MVLHLSFSWTVTIVFHVPLCGANLGLSHYGENTDWGWLYTRCWGRFGPTMKEVTECWRKMHENEHHDLHPLPNMDDKIQVAEMCGACVTHKRREKHMQFWLENVKERKSLGRASCWRKNIKMDLKKMAQEVVDCIHLVQDSNEWQSFVIMVPKFWFPQN